MEVVLENESAEPAAATGSPDRDERVAELEKQVLYLRAEIENVRKRTEKRGQDAAEFAAEPLLVDILPVLDNLERATEYAREPTSLEAVRNGLEQIIRQLRDVLAKHEVEPIAAEQETFDPSLHEAIGVVAGEESGRVAAVHEKGYRFKGRLLRPAKVSVSRPVSGLGAQQNDDK
jgi:molecular chaperone GrpE